MLYILSIFIEIGKGNNFVTSPCTCCTYFLYLLKLVKETIL